MQTELAPISPSSLVHNDKVPLALYLHFPWCKQKCPYCDFNSKVLTNKNLVTGYLSRLKLDLLRFSKMLQVGGALPRIISLFIGGGSPNLLTSSEIADLIAFAARYFNFDPKIEITLEANPTLTRRYAKALITAGVNRLSLGVQSFDETKLKSIGRLKVASPETIRRHISEVLEAGFSNLNIDLMYGLPSQTPEEACLDLEAALKFNLSHISWYQLTLTKERLAWWRAHGLTLPNALEIEAIEEAGRSYLSTKQFSRYEISSYARRLSGAKRLAQCKHNLNYWSYGDYLGLGPGASGKLTLENGKVLRWQNPMLPNNFLFNSAEWIDSKKQRLEFMLNAGRLLIKVPHKWWQQRVQQADKAWWKHKLKDLASRNLIKLAPSYFQVTKLGSNLLDSWLVEF